MCVCQALRPADLEALVRPVTPQSPPQFAALQIPYLDSIIIPTTGQEEAIRAALERLDRPLMRLSHPHALPTLQVPPAEHAIAAATDQHRSGRAPGQRVHDLARLAQGVHALPATRLPDEEFTPATPPTPTGQTRAIPTPSHIGCHATRPLQRSPQRAIGHLPQAHTPIIAPPRQHGTFSILRST